MGWCHGPEEVGSSLSRPSRAQADCLAVLAVNCSSLRSLPDLQLTPQLFISCFPFPTGGAVAVAANENVAQGTRRTAQQASS